MKLPSLGIILHKLKKAVSVEGRQVVYQGLSNFLYERSNDMPVIMLALNSIGILSGHFAQMRGLQKSKRENKDYLIKQEKSEIGLDIAITILPPFIIDKLLEKQVDSGKLSTKSFRKFLIERLAPTIGVETKDLFNTDNYVGPIKMIVNSIISFIKTFEDNPKIPDSINEKIKKLNLNKVINGYNNKVKKLKDNPIFPEFLKKFLKETEGVKEHVPIASVDLMGAYAAHPKYAKSFKDCFNGMVKDEVCSQRNGYRIAPTLLYTIIASNIIIPILSNKIAKNNYRKELAAKGETPESIKHKKIYKPLLDNKEIENKDNVFNIFSNSYSSNTKNEIEDKRMYKNLKEKPIDKNNIFSNIDRINRISSQPSGLRI